MSLCYYARSRFTKSIGSTSPRPFSSRAQRRPESARSHRSTTASIGSRQFSESGRHDCGRFGRRFTRLRMSTTVIGGTPAHRRLTEEIVAGLGDTSLERIRLEEWVDSFEEHPSLELVPTLEEIEASRGVGVRLERPH